MTKKQSKATQQATMQRASERAAAIRAEHERKERRTRTLLVTSVVVGVLILVVAIFTAVQASRDTTGQSAAAPAGAVGGGYAVPMGPDGAKATVTVYEDFMCPYCGQFEKISEDTLRKYVDAGGVQVRYHVVSFLDNASSTEYSTRAANALAVVLDTAGPQVAIKFHNLLYANQPQEGSAGLSDDQLIALAVQAGAKKDAVAGPIGDLKFKKWVVNSTGDWSGRGFTGTPSVTVNGKKIAFNSAEELLSNTEAAIKDALAK